MINTIRKFLKSNDNSKSDNLEGNQDELAYASLLIEVIKSDDHFDQREHDELLNILGTKLSIGEKALDELSELAQKKSNESGKRVASAFTSHRGPKPRQNGTNRGVFSVDISFGGLKIFPCSHTF